MTRCPVLLEVGPGRNLATLASRSSAMWRVPLIHSIAAACRERGAGEVKIDAAELRRSCGLRACRSTGAAATRASGASSAFCRPTRSSGGAIGSSRTSSRRPAAGGRLPLCDRAPDWARPGARSYAKLLHGDSDLEAGAIFRSVRSRSAKRKAASLAVCQSDRKDRQADRGGIARTRRQESPSIEKGAEFKNIRRRAFTLDPTDEADLAAAVQDGDQSAGESGSGSSRLFLRSVAGPKPELVEARYRRKSTTSSMRRSC